MKKIIRLNAVETLSQRDNLEVQVSDLHPRQASIVGSHLLSAKVTLSVLDSSRDIFIKNKTNRSASFENQALSALLSISLGNKLDFSLPVIFWQCTEKIVQVRYTPRKGITTIITEILGMITARTEKAVPKALIFQVYLFRFFPNIQQRTQLGVKIAQTKTWLNSILIQLTQQSSFRNRFFALSYGNY